MPDMTAKAAFRALDIRPPKLDSTTSHADQQAAFASWKEHELPRLFKRAQKKYHPDVYDGPDRETRFVQLEPAYKTLLLLQVQRPARKICPCGEPLVPGNFCGFCCRRSPRLAKANSCPVCKTPRTNTHHKCCTECGFVYVPASKLFDMFRNTS